MNPLVVDSNRGLWKSAPAGHPIPEVKLLFKVSTQGWIHRGGLEPGTLEWRPGRQLIPEVTAKATNQGWINWGGQKPVSWERVPLGGIKQQRPVSVVKSLGCRTTKLRNCVTVQIRWFVAGWLCLNDSLRWPSVMASENDTQRM